MPAPASNRNVRRFILIFVSPRVFEVDERGAR
jgi:hypothetical protein